MLRCYRASEFLEHIYGPFLLTGLNTAKVVTIPIVSALSSCTAGYITRVNEIFDNDDNAHEFMGPNGNLNISGTEEI